MDSEQRNDDIAMSTSPSDDLGDIPGMASTTAVETTRQNANPVRATWRLLIHPAHLLSLGGGSGLSPVAPGTVGTLWAWLAFHVLQMYVPAQAWPWLLLLGLPVGVWACTCTAQRLRVADPSAVVWDEVWAFWAILWIITPCGWGWQVAAFGVFRFFDAVKPGPVRWADGLYKVRPDAAGRLSIGWRQGWGIMWDDIVAAACTLMTLAVAQRCLA